MADLKYDKNQIRRVFREGMMRESVIYQEIFQEGEEQGRTQERRSLILLQLEQRFGTLSEQERVAFGSAKLSAFLHSI